MFPQFFFGYCALMIVASGLLAISLRNPVHCVLMVLVLFFHMAGLYLTLNAEFLAAVQIIVYAGAILVLYLFVLFLVSLREELHLTAFVPNAWLGRIIATGLAVGLIATIPAFTLGEKGVWTVDAIRQVTHTKALGQELFATYLLPFEIAGLILLVALIGGLVLARRDQGGGESDSASGGTAGDAGPEPVADCREVGR
ncbi:MAG: NADH-quinone oxidoreductase subunit J [Desulfobulbus sp.]|jgi:NADH-quinone oxidoreductase subunit J|uniref:NADH-quinone oxidoreductase subunit J family protein n=1 Tax=Desulfobulbus sp. TaxID=895 RepID=UPI00283DB10C|nr:NADH-quinone oxidoreductase subunit J [Desulfobulbus sp.]MDR2550985.1 NADH-quinone oxidoreductase subunit J [Desulfobulbus sp.]